MIFIIILSIILWFLGKPIFLSGKDEEIYTGMVEARNVNIKSQVSGEMETIHVYEGEYVKKGSLLYDLNDRDYKIDREKAIQSINISKNRIKDLEEGFSMEEIDQVKAKISQNYAKILAFDKERRNLKDKYEQILELEKVGAASANEVKDIQLALEKVKYELEGLKFSEEELNLKLKDMENGMDKNQIEISKGELNIAELNLQSAENIIKKCHKESPIAGTIEEIYYDEGEFIPAGSSILNIIDFSDKWVEAYVEEKNLAILKLEKHVNVRAYGSEKIIEGKISYISRLGEFTPKNIESKESKEEIVYKIKIVTEGKNEFLKPGMFVDVIIPKR